MNLPVRSLTFHHQNHKIVVFVTILIACKVTCYPLPTELETKPESRDEKAYPNGTVVGKYSYLDNEGNPVHVKYYADDQSYGVELSSVKIVKGDKEKAAPNTNTLSKTEHAKSDLLSENLKHSSFTKKGMNHDSLDSYNKEHQKPHLRNKYRDSDYEIYLQNELPAAKCGGDADKVKIYNFERDDRKIPNTLNSVKAADNVDDEPDNAKYCERY